MKQLVRVIAIISLAIIISMFCGCKKAEATKVVETTPQEIFFVAEPKEYIVELAEAAVPVETTEPVVEPVIIETEEVIIEEVVEEEPEPVYEDSNVKVTYAGYEVKAYGPVIYFNVENLSSKSLTVLCTDVYIDGCRVYTSGLTCEKLAAGTETVEEFVLLPEDNVDVYDVDKVSFIVKLVNAKSYLDLYESGYVTVEL